MNFFLQCYIKMIVTAFPLNFSMFPQFDLNSWFLSVIIIYLDSRNLMWTRKKQSYHQYRYTCIYHRCELWTIVWGIMREWSYYMYMYLTVTNLSILCQIMRNRRGEKNKRNIKLRENDIWTFCGLPKRIQQFSIIIVLMIS